MTVLQCTKTIFWIRDSPGLSLVCRLSSTTTMLWSAMFGRAASQHHDLCPLFPKQRIGNTREPQCFCVSHSHFDLRSHVFFRLHKLCICWTNEHPPLIELLGELWIAEYCLYHPHQCSDDMSSRCGLAEKDLPGLLERFLYTHTTRSREPQNVNIPPGLACVTTHHCFVVCLCMCVYWGVRSYACVCVVCLVDSHKTDPCCLYYLSDLSKLLCSSNT